MSFRVRLIVAVSLVIALSFGIGGTVLISVSFQDALQAQETASLETYASVRNTLYLLNSVGSQTDYKSLENALSKLRVRWQAMSLEAGENVICASKGEALSGYSFQTSDSQQCRYRVVEDGYGNGMIVCGSIQAGEDLLSLRMRFDLTQVYELRRTQQRIYTVVYCVVLAAGVLTAWALAYFMTKRLKKLTSAVRRISGGDLSRRVHLQPGDEFGQLGKDFDIMADKLQQNIQAMEGEMQRQEAFMGAFAHELKTPMTSIIGYADLLRQGGLDDTTRTLAANYIFSEGQRLEKLSFKLLELLLLQNEKLEMKPVSLSAFLLEVEQALSTVLRDRGIRLVCRGERGQAVFEPDLVRSLLYNLIDNAAKAMDSGGIIAVKGTVIPGGCEFLVADNGRGMEPKELHRITEAFYRVDKSRSRQQGGAGLGLALCKRIVELHKGDLRFASAVGTGTRVHVRLQGEGSYENS